ncbi:MAG: DUF1329 domain-containing protein [Deltaproteobacteria bacterium]|nr:DUF1329 domain-containing protein [Deltaproteobacteria bacterium]
MGRRRFLETAGALAGLWALRSAAPGWGIRPATALEELGGGRIGVGATISRDNLSVVKDLLPAGTYEQIARYGLELTVAPTTTDASLLVPARWLAVSERNRGLAMLDEQGQLRVRDGGPWIGGFPFPEPKTGLEAAWNIASASWIEYADDFSYAGGEHLIRKGESYRSLEWVFAGISTVGRTRLEPTPSWPGHEDELYRLLIRYVAPFDYRGLAVLTVRPYDQTLLERAYAYAPTTRRVREVPTYQRWESASGNDIFRSDHNGNNDPLSRWSWRLVERRPMILPGVSEGYQIDPWPTIAGRFPRGRWELRPEVQVLEAVPKDPQCPYAKKILYVDSVMRKALVFDFYDRSGRVWKTGTHHHARVRQGGETVISFNHPNHTMDLLADHVTYIYVDAASVEKNAGKKLEDFWTTEAMLRAAY